MRKGTAKIYHWAMDKASCEKSSLWLALLFSLELILFIPLDAVLMFFCLQKRSSIFSYLLIATIFSTLSGVIGYLLGHFLWDLIGGWVVPHLIAESSFQKMSGHLQHYEHWAVFGGSLVPFPLKILSVTAGVFQIGLAPFIFCLVAGRLLRFTLIGASMALWGEKVKLFVDKHFHRLFLLVGAKMAGALLFFWVLSR